MKSFHLITVAAALAFAASPLMAGDKGECAKGAAHEAKSCCTATFANLNLSADQKAKLEKAEADCDKAGCTKESMQAFMKKAQGILSKEQYAKLKSECDKHMQQDEGTRS